MKFKYFFPVLMLFPLCSFSTPQITNSEASNNIEEITYTSESANKELNTSNLSRTVDFPTQIIRVNGTIENQKLSCAEIHKHINKVLVAHIAIKEKFDYGIYIYCKYNPDNGLAVEFKIESYFDPITNEAINDLNTFISQYNGIDLFGTPLKVEPAKGLVVSLNFAAGIKKSLTKPPFIQYRKDRNSLYFKSNYEMKSKLLTDIHDNFFSHNPDQILPFLDKWLFANASNIYKGILKESNYTEIEPERIFLMENNEEVFTSGLKQYFMNQCSQTENHHCL